MRGDFSRLPAGLGLDCDRVLMQQGRVQLDADWNTQAELVARQMRDLARDATGADGAPADRPGFGVVALGGLALGPGLPGIVVAPRGEFAAAAGDAFTVECWLCPGADQEAVSLVSVDGGEAGFALLLDGARRVCFALWESEARAPRVFASGGALEVGRYTHVAAVHDGREVRVYLDGRLAHAAGDARGLRVAGGALTVGGTGRHGAQPAADAGEAAEGPTLLDDVQVWRRALGPEEILCGMAAGGEASGEGLVLRAEFDAEGGAVLRRAGGDARAVPDPPDADRLHPPVFWLTAGRFYAGGLSVENDGCRRIDLDTSESASVVYLEAVETAVSVTGDPSIAEVALGGADTTLRVRTGWRVAAMPLGAWLTEDAPRAEPRMRARRCPVSESLANTLYRVEIHHSGWTQGVDPARGAAVEFRLESLDPGAGTAELKGPVGPLGPALSGRPVEIVPAEGKPFAGRVTKAGTDRLTIDPLPPGAEPGDTVALRPVASFKWARDNASVAARIAAAAGARLTLDAGPYAATRIVAGLWAELAPDPGAGRAEVPGTIVRIDDVERGTGGGVTVTVSPAPPDEAAAPAILTVWEPSATDASQPVTPVVAGAWLALENGVEVAFEAEAELPSGAYWGLPARDRTQDILWPAGTEGPAAVAAHVPRRDRAALALVRTGEGRPKVSDLRRVFVALADLAPAGGRHPPGSLAVRGDLIVRRDAWIEGRLKAGRFDGRLGPGVVTTEAIGDRAVTAEKLAAPGGLVPEGAVLAFEAPEPLPGYAATGATVAAEVASPAWRALPGAVAEIGPLLAEALGGHLYLLGREGAFLRFDPGRPEAPFLYLPPLPGPPPGEGARLTAAGGRLYLTGGAGPSGGKSARVVAYHPADGAWRDCAPLLYPRAWHGAAARDGQLWVFGGRRRALGGLLPNWITAAAELYDHADDRWTETRALLAARSAFGVATRPAAVHALGGEARGFLGLFGSRRVGWHDVCETSSGRWRAAQPLPEAVLPWAAGLVGRRPWVLGGGRGRGAAAWLFDHAAHVWQALPAPGMSLAGGGAGLLDGTAYAFGAEGAEAMALGPVLFLHRRLGAETAAAEDEDDGGAEA